MTRIWTIQPAQVWERLRKKQSLYVEEKSEGYRGYIPRSYRWLQWQLYSRLPEYSGHMPWWTHCGKPDLRRYRHTRQAGTIEVRLELEIADKSFLRFPSWAWQRVFCQDYLAATREEYEDWTKALQLAVPDEDTWPLPEPWRSQLESSWQRLFDRDLPVLDWDESWGWSRIACEEAVFEVLQLSDVRHVTSFQGTFPSGNNRTEARTSLSRKLDRISGNGTSKRRPRRSRRLQ
jgi:Domain of unknown function (DUF3841)